jgi:hypothetical protein
MERFMRLEERDTVRDTLSVGDVGSLLKLAALSEKSNPFPTISSVSEFNSILNDPNDNNAVIFRNGGDMYPRLRMTKVQTNKERKFLASVNQSTLTREPIRHVGASLFGVNSAVTAVFDQNTTGLNILSNNIYSSARKHPRDNWDAY